VKSGGIRNLDQGIMETDVRLDLRILYLLHTHHPSQVKTPTNPRYRTDKPTDRTGPSFFISSEIGLSSSGESRRGTLVHIEATVFHTITIDWNSDAPSSNVFLSP